MKSSGELAIVLHSHMPYVEGFGTWPFGEEWLWEAIATSYLPLLDVLDRAPVTLSLTPVLCDQLEAPGAMERCLRFLREIRPASHRLDIEECRAAGQDELVGELERSAAEYAAAADRLEALSGGLVAGAEGAVAGGGSGPGGMGGGGSGARGERAGVGGEHTGVSREHTGVGGEHTGVGTGLLAAFAPHARWTSAATHAILPLLATDAAVALQVETAIASHRRRFGAWDGGFWLPECAHAPWLDGLLEDFGVHAACVELTGVFGFGSPEHLRPLATDEGPVLWPIDRAVIDLVWSEGGYPAAGAYRDYHRHTRCRHRPWANAGGPYDVAAARALAREHGADFVARVLARVRDGGVCVCAVDTELLGHWWYEGVWWLEAVVQESARQGLALTTLDDALTRHEPVPAPAGLPATTWGQGSDLSTWSGPSVADLVWQARSAELAVVRRGGAVPLRAVRELLALQSSDWAFLATRELAGDYPRERAQGHAEELARMLAGAGGDPHLRNLAPDLGARGWL